MKTLFYKEMKLSMHPICYVFAILFPLMILIPSYPIAVLFLYALTTYPVLFLGANKGQQSNDLLYSTLLPVRKKDIVLARLMTVGFIQLLFIVISGVLSPLAKLTQKAIIEDGGELEAVGLGPEAFISVVAFALIGYSIADLIYFAIYYKKGKSIIASTLITVLAFTFFMITTTVILPLNESMAWYMDFFGGKITNQLISLVVSLVIYAAMHYLTYVISAKELEKVDF